MLLPVSIVGFLSWLSRIPWQECAKIYLFSCDEHLDYFQFEPKRRDCYKDTCSTLLVDMYSNFLWFWVIGLMHTYIYEKV